MKVDSIVGLPLIIQNPVSLGLARTLYFQTIYSLFIAGVTTHVLPLTNLALFMNSHDSQCKISREVASGGNKFAGNI